MRIAKNAISMLPSPAAAPASKSQAPRTMSPQIQKLLGAFALYESVVTDPKDAELQMMIFLRGRLYWRHNRFGDAIPVFEQIVKTHPGSKVGEYSANLLLDSLNRTKRYAEMERWVTAMLGDQKLLAGRADLRSRLLLLQKKMNGAKAP